MVNNKKVMAICLVQYILLLAYHLLYSLISGTQDQTNRVIVWSFCVLIILINFGYFFKNQVKIIVLFTMLSVIVSITYIGCVMHCLAFSVVIFFTAGLILSMLLNEKFVLYWSVASSLTLVLYTLIWPGILLEMVSSMFLYYGYIMAYIMGCVDLYILVRNCSRYYTDISDRNKQILTENNQKNIFWANISNEIKTPMNVINGMSRLLKAENLNVRANEYTDQIENASEMLLNIVNNTLELSIFESGTYIKQNKPYDICRLVSDVIMHAYGNIHSDNINLVYCIRPNVPLDLYGDADLISKIVNNLLMNALVFTEEGEIRVDVDSIKNDYKKDVSDIVITISDSGNGFDMEDIDFDLFFSGYDKDAFSYNSEIESVGLSLRLCKTMIDTLGGKIEVSSIPGKGTSFKITFEQSTRIPEELESEADTDSRFQHLVPLSGSVLIVDDTPTNLKLISGLIRLHGIEPDTAQSGRQCIELMEEKKYDLVLLDYMMPDLNGFDTYKQIKAHTDNENFTSVKIVLLTSKSSQRNKEKFLEMGFDDCLMKPVNDKDLETILYKFLYEENN